MLSAALPISGLFAATLRAIVLYVLPCTRKNRLVGNATRQSPRKREELSDEEHIGRASTACHHYLTISNVCVVEKYVSYVLFPCMREACFSKGWTTRVAVAEAVLPCRRLITENEPASSLVSWDRRLSSVRKVILLLRGEPCLEVAMKRYET